MSAKKKDSLKYGEARQRLEEILKEIEGNAVDVDDLADRVKEAAGLIQLLRKKLEKTRLEVEKVVVELEPGEGEGAASGPPPEKGGDVEGEGGEAGGEEALPF